MNILANLLAFCILLHAIKLAVASCEGVYDPVCGVDGRTYLAACWAEEASIQIAHYGQCTDGRSALETTSSRPSTKCACPKIHSPVCGKDGKTYTNGCIAKCRGAMVKHKGRCKEMKQKEKQKEHTETGNKWRIASFSIPQAQYRCGCQRNVYDPVCGTDGNTYTNGCMAKCAGVQIVSVGKCEMVPNIYRTGRVGVCDPCPKIYLPVCGYDMITYGNHCLAQCAGVEVHYPYACVYDTY